MAHKLKLRDLGMDTMERLYYERKEARQKAYAAKRRKTTKIKERPDIRLRKKSETDVFNISLKKAI